MNIAVTGFVDGLVTMTFVVIGVFFVKFWHRTRDPLFIAFAIAFWLLALNESLLATNVVPSEERGWTYLLRVAAFVFIAIAIVRKNAERGR
jgi:K+ transporter